MFPEKNALKNFANFAGKHLYWSRFLIKLQAFMRFLRISFFAEHLLWLAGSVDFRLDKRRQIALTQKLLSLHKKWSFSLTIFSVNVTFTEEILNGKLQFLCSVFFQCNFSFNFNFRIDKKKAQVTFYDLTRIFEVWVTRDNK